MHTTAFFAALLAAAGPVMAQHLGFEPPEVQEALAAMSSKYAAWYAGPTGGHHRTASLTSKTRPTPAAATDCSYWLEDINHQGYAPYSSNPGSYKVFRNVMDPPYNAKGDGVTDDTAAINLAISDGGRCAPGSCSSTSTTPALVYFPYGVYNITSPLIDIYYTQLIGNPNCLPTLKADLNFNGTGYGQVKKVQQNFGIIEANPITNGGAGRAYGSTNIFWRQIRNFIIDTTNVPAKSPMVGIHWPTSQATSVQNVDFIMPKDAGVQHIGLFIDGGSGGFLSDLTFTGGYQGMAVGNQQFTMRNLVFDSIRTAISYTYDWGWSWYGLQLKNCSVGIDMSSGGIGKLRVGSIALFDSSFTGTGVGILTGKTSTSFPDTNNSIILENISLDSTPIVVKDGSGNTVLSGTLSRSSVSAWGEGHSYTAAGSGPTSFQGSISPVSRPGSLTSSNGAYYQESKPQYESVSSGNVVSVRSFGAKGDGQTDDTTAFQNAINSAQSSGQVLFVDHGYYVVTNTLYIPPGSQIVGESYPVILSSGSYFNQISAPQPVVQLGKSGDSGTIQWSDMIVSTRGQQQGAILMEYNIQSSSSSPTGAWDVHARIGGFAGSNLQYADCPFTTKTVKAKKLKTKCIAGFLTIHIAPSATGIYIENNWFWTADHDVDDPQLRRLNIYNGRGLLDESAGPVWLVGTGVEHHVKYEYQFTKAQNVFAGFIQSETAYYQPNPNANLPFAYNAAYSDPQFTKSFVQADGSTIPAADGWGLRVINSTSVNIYGAGHYSFFDNYVTDCNAANNATCQNHIVSLEGSNSQINLYTLLTVGTHYMISVDGKDFGKYSDNLGVFPQCIALYRTAT